eukprot:1395418-Amorphochlora_amoeboformis.AAC.1
MKVVVTQKKTKVTTNPNPNPNPNPYPNPNPNANPNPNRYRNVQGYQEGVQASFHTHVGLVDGLQEIQYMPTIYLVYVDSLDSRGYPRYLELCGLEVFLEIIDYINCFAGTLPTRSSPSFCLVSRVCG